MTSCVSTLRYTMEVGAADRSRTCNLPLTRLLLCQLSYSGKCFVVFFIFQGGCWNNPHPIFRVPHPESVFLLSRLILYYIIYII